MAASEDSETAVSAGSDSAPEELSAHREPSLAADSPAETSGVGGKPQGTKRAPRASASASGSKRTASKTSSAANASKTTARTTAAQRGSQTRKTPKASTAARTKPMLPPTRSAPPPSAPVALHCEELNKSFGANRAVDDISFTVRQGSFFGVVGPNGAGKTTTLSIATGLLRPDSGSVLVKNVNVWTHPAEAKRVMGVLPDRLRLFDRLTGAQLLYFTGILRGLDTQTIKTRTQELAEAFGLEDALGRVVSDYSSGMTKKIALACALIHSPEVVILDEPFEAVDPVSASHITEILEKFSASGGTVVLSSHNLELIERVCDSLVIIVNGQILAHGTVDEVRLGAPLEQRFLQLADGTVSEKLEWLHNSSA